MCPQVILLSRNLLLIVSSYSGPNKMLTDRFIFHFMKNSVFSNNNPGLYPVSKVHPPLLLVFAPLFRNGVLKHGVLKICPL